MFRKALLISILAFCMTKLKGQTSILYWSDAPLMKINAITTHDLHFQEILTEGLGFAWRIAVDPLHNKIYWTNVEKNLVQRADLDGNNVEDLANVTYPQGVAVDPKNQTIYVAESGTPLIFSMDFSGHHWDTLLSEALSDPDDLHLDLRRGKMYWVDTGNKALMEANLDGSGLRALKFEGLKNPQAMSVDQESNEIFWLEADGRLLKANIRGSKVNLIVSGLKNPTSLALDKEQKKIYWAETGTPAIKRANLDGTNVEVIYEKIDLGKFHIGLAILNPQ